MSSGVYIHKIVNIQCATCGIIFGAKKKTAKFCSDKCKYEFKHPKREKKCELCGNAFITTNSRKRFCTEACNKKADNKKRGNWAAGSNTFKCKLCGKKRRFKVNTTNKFCSRECFQTHAKINHNSNGVFIEPNKCIICGVKPVTRTTDYCSDECRNSHKHVCIYCGLEFAGAKGKKYCSQRCSHLAQYVNSIHYLRKRNNINNKCRECEKIINNDHHGVKFRFYCGAKCQKKACRRTSRHRRKAKVKLLKHNFTPLKWRKSKHTFNNRCAYCGELSDKPLHQDHFIPLSKGGSYTEDNIVPACHRCNSNKSDNDPFDWYAGQSFYSKVREDMLVDYLNSRMNKCA